MDKKQFKEFCQNEFKARGFKKQRNVRIEGKNKIFCGRTKSKKVYVLEESYL